MYIYIYIKNLKKKTLIVFSFSNISESKLNTFIKLKNDKQFDFDSEMLLNEK